MEFINQKVSLKISLEIFKLAHCSRANSKLRYKKKVEIAVYGY